MFWKFQIMFPKSSFSQLDQHSHKRSSPKPPIDTPKYTCQRAGWFTLQQNKNNNNNYRLVVNRGWLVPCTIAIFRDSDTTTKGTTVIRHYYNPCTLSKGEDTPEYMWKFSRIQKKDQHKVWNEVEQILEPKTVGWWETE